jgi:hypothetical protein
LVGPAIPIAATIEKTASAPHARGKDTFVRIIDVSLSQRRECATVARNALKKLAKSLTPLTHVVSRNNENVAKKFREARQFSTRREPAQPRQLRGPAMWQLASQSFRADSPSCASCEGVAARQSMK